MLRYMHVFLDLKRHPVVAFKPKKGVASSDHLSS